MHILENGILEDSEIHFLLPSAFAVENLYCLQHIGIFHCDSRYCATHPYWESILIIFIDEGTLEVSYSDHHFQATTNDIVIIDCRQQHTYRANENLKFHYFHFTGPSSLGYAQLLYKLNQGALISNAQDEILKNIFSNLLHLAKSQINTQNEHRISVYIHMILCQLVEDSSNTHLVENKDIDRIIHYMEQHLTENISLDTMAQKINLSKFYFNRYFKKHMGMTPHQYLIHLRIQHAKKLLSTSYDSIEKISELCGFDTSSNFIRSFKKRVGMTPTDFRKIPF